MTSQSFHLTLGFLAAFYFAVLPGCESQSSTTVTEATESDHSHEDGDHDHDHADGDHDHDHADGDHDHADGDHDHADGDHDHAAADHDHDFESLGEALKEIESLRDTIRDEFAAGDPDAAHDPLHHIGEVLIATEGVVEKMTDPKAKAAAAAAVESLLDDFTAVDEGMHGSDENKSQGKSYKDVSKSVDEAIATLKKEAE